MQGESQAAVAFARWAWPLLVLVLGLTLITVVTWTVGDRVLNRTITEMLIRVVVVVGLYIFIGNSGVLSFGHIGFMAIGAYATAWQTCCPRLKPMTMPGLPDFLLQNTVPFLPAVTFAGMLAAAVAFLLGLIILRLSGIAASIATFAFLVIVNVVYSNWSRVTGGTSSIIGIPIQADLWTTLAWATLAMAAAYVYQTSRYGLALRSSREDVVAARAAGVDVTRQRLIAFVLSAFFVGVGGALHGHFLGVLTPDVFYLQLTFITLAMLVVGGINSLAGAVVGVAVLSAVIELFRQLERGVPLGEATLSLPAGSQEIALGVLMLLILALRRSGITGNREITWPWRPPQARETAPVHRFSPSGGLKES